VSAGGGAGAGSGLDFLSSRMKKYQKAQPPPARTTEKQQAAAKINIKTMGDILDMERANLITLSLAGLFSRCGTAVAGQGRDVLGAQGLLCGGGLDLLSIKAEANIVLGHGVDFDRFFNRY
jgi:hypothetical protein